MHQKGFISSAFGIVVTLVIAAGVGGYIYSQSLVSDYEETVPAFYPQGNAQLPPPRPAWEETLPSPRPARIESLSDRLNAEVVYVTVDDLVRFPKIFLDKKVRVSGNLINTKESYFPSPEFAIANREDSQTHFKVTAWLPIEVPPPAPDPTQEQSPTMQSYLNRFVDLTGVIRQAGASFYLEVSSGGHVRVD